MMGRKSRIAVIAVVTVLALVTIGAYAYDSTQKDKIADGVTIAGIDVGGLERDEAAALVRRELVQPLKDSVEVSFREETWTLSGERLKVRADVDAAVDKALAESQDGGLPGRLVRYVTGEEVEHTITPTVEYSKSAVNQFVRGVAEAVNRDPEDADVEADGSGVQVVNGEEGRKLRDNLLTRELEEAVFTAGTRTIEAHVQSTQPEVTRKEVASEYPTYLTLDRANYTLRLWKNLELAKTYTVAVGQIGLETPAGLYAIQDKQVEPTWHVPDSDWAGDLAGEVIPPGPSNPLKARWMGIYEGAGIHGTAETESLGTAASHGCVRMAVPDVEELYEEVEVGTPIYIG